MSRRLLQTNYLEIYHSNNANLKSREMRVSTDALRNVYVDVSRVNSKQKNLQLKRLSNRMVAQYEEWSWLYKLMLIGIALMKFYCNHYIDILWKCAKANANDDERNHTVERPINALFGTLFQVYNYLFWMCSIIIHSVPWKASNLYATCSIKRKSLVIKNLRKTLKL